MLCDEIPLPGGRITQGVFKKCNYVLRPCCPNSVFVHETLRWLEKKGVSVAPKFVGLADDGREITTFLDGSSPEDLRTFKGNPQWQPTDKQLFEVGNIIKTIHTALSDFPGCLNGQTVCHNDLSPCNFMFKDDIPYAVFDWDAAEIGDPLNDLAYAAWMWSDIGNGEHSPDQKGHEIKLILDAYELCIERRKMLMEKIHEQIQRVGKSSLAANRIPTYQWTIDVEVYLSKTKMKLRHTFCNKTEEKMRLLLSGGGDPERVVHMDKFFISKIDPRKPVLYIPVAWEDDPTYAECNDWFKTTYQPYGIKNIEMCTDLKNVPDLESYTAVFIGDGNTFKLLKEIKDSQFDQKLKDYLFNNGFVYGGSAGSIIFGKDIIGMTYEDENNVGLEDSKGLNLVKGYNICCHYGDGDEANTKGKHDRIKAFSEPSDVTIALPENCAVYVEDDKITFLGSGTIMFIRS